MMMLLPRPLSPLGLPPLKSDFELTAKPRNPVEQCSALTGLADLDFKEVLASKRERRILCGLNLQLIFPLKDDLYSMSMKLTDDLLMLWWTRLE